MIPGVALMFSFLQANSQCYTQLDDASGYDRSTSFYVVEDAACQLMDSIPTEFRDSFGIYGFGFYRLVDHYSDYNHEDIFEEVIENEVYKPYYIVFGRESDKSGLYTKYHLKVNSSFCLVQGNEASEAWIENELNKVLTAELSSPSRLAEAEKSAIYRYLEIYIPSNDCCDQYWKGSGCGLGCIWTKEKVLEYLQDNNFTTEPCLSNFQGAIDSCICDYQYSFTYNSIDSGSYQIDYQTSISSIDHKGRTVTFDSFYKFLNSLAQEYKDQGVKFYGAITDQTIFCYGAPALILRDQTSKSSSELNFRNVESRYNEAEVAVWYSIYYEEGESYLSVKVKGLNTDGMPTLKECAQSIIAKSAVLENLKKRDVYDANVVRSIAEADCLCKSDFENYLKCSEEAICSFNLKSYAKEHNMSRFEYILDRFYSEGCDCVSRLYTYTNCLNYNISKSLED